MTCIVGLELEGKVYIGGDSAGASGWEVRAVNTPKVFINGEFLIGYTSSFRMGQILQHIWEPPQHAAGRSDMKYMVADVAESIREVLKKNGFSKVDNNVEEGGFFLCGYRGKLYCIEDSYQVISHEDRFDAIGCGRDYALGVLWQHPALKYHKDPTKLMLASLQTAAHFSGGVMGPFKILSIGEEEHG